MLDSITFFIFHDIEMWWCPTSIIVVIFLGVSRPRVYAPLLLGGAAVAVGTSISYYKSQTLQDLLSNIISTPKVSAAEKRYQNSVSLRLRFKF